MALVAEYFFNGADSGTTPTTITDNTGNGNDLTLTADGSNLVWMTGTGGRGLQNVADANTSSGRASGSATALRTALNNKQQFGFVAKLTAVAGTGAVGFSTIFFLGNEAGSNQDFLAFGINGYGQIVGMFNNQGFIWYQNFGSNPVIAVWVDSTAAEADRVQIYINGTRATGYPEGGGGAVTLNSTLTGLTGAGISLSVMNRDTGNFNPLGSIKYLAFFDAVENADFNSTVSAALISNDDASPIPSPPALAFSVAPAVENLVYNGFDVTLTTNLAATVDILLTADGTVTQPDEVTFDNASWGGGASAGVEATYSFSAGFSAGTSYELWIRAVNDADTDDRIYTTVPVSVPAQAPIISNVNTTNIIVDGAEYTINWDNGATDTTSATLNGVAQTGYSVDSDTVSRATHVWQNSLYNTSITLNVDSGYETHTVQVAPAAGYAVVTIGATYSHDDADIQGSAQLVAGDQYLMATTTSNGFNAVGDANGMITISNWDGVTDPGTLQYRVIDQSDGARSDWATFTISTPVNDTVPDQFTVGADVAGAEPGSETIRSFVLAGTTAGVDVTVSGYIDGLVSTTGAAGAGVASIARQVGDTVYVHGIAGSAGASRIIGAFCNGVSDTFVLASRAAEAPTITAQPSGPSATSVGAAVTISATVTGYSSLQWYSNGVAIPGATSLPLAFTPAAVDSYSLDFVATSSEGASVTSSAHVVTAIALATRIVIPAGVVTGRGVSMAGQTVTVNVWADDGGKAGAFLHSTSVTLAASGATNLDSNQNGAAGATRWYSFPSATGGNSEAFFQTTVQAIP